MGADTRPHFSFLPPTNIFSDFGAEKFLTNGLLKTIINFNSASDASNIIWNKKIKLICLVPINILSIKPGSGKDAQ